MSLQYTFISKLYLQTFQTYIFFIHTKIPHHNPTLSTYLIIFFQWCILFYFTCTIICFHTYQKPLVFTRKGISPAGSESRWAWWIDQLICTYRKDFAISNSTHSPLIPPPTPPKKKQKIQSPLHTPISLALQKLFPVRACNGKCKSSYFMLQTTSWLYMLHILHLYF